MARQKKYMELAITTVEGTSRFYKAQTYWRTDKSVWGHPINTFRTESELIKFLSGLKDGTPIMISNWTIDVS